MSTLSSLKKCIYSKSLKTPSKFKNKSYDRRTFINFTGLSSSLLLLKQEKALSEEFEFSACDKFMNNNPEIPFIAPFSSPEPIYYPNWLFGEWNVNSIQKDNQKQFKFRLKFYSTFPDTFENQLKFNLGLAIPKAAVIADRAFNFKQICNTYLGRPEVDNIEYFPRIKKIRNLITADFLPNGDTNQERLPSKINIIKTEQDQTDFNDEFCCSEIFRPVLEGGQTSDSISYIENVYKFTKKGKNEIFGKQRIIFYKQLQGMKQFVGSQKPFIIYDFDLDMKLVTPEEQGLGTGDYRCVENPKAIVQCA